MKSIILLILFFLLYSQSSAFSDTQDSEYESSIQSLKSQDIVEGYEDGTYRPDQNINRVEFLKILLESNNDELDIHNRFIAHDLPDYYSDTPFGVWYGIYVVAASELGIVEGYPDGTFRPGNSINYAEASKIIVETFGLPVPQYFRVPDHWYEPYVEAINGIMGQPRENISAADLVTRGEMAYMIVQAQQATFIPDDGGISPLTVIDTPHPGEEVTTGYITNYDQWQAARFGPSISNLQPLDISTASVAEILFENINTERSREGVAALSHSDQLADLSQNFVEHLVINGIYSHTDMLGQDPFERAGLAGYEGFVAESMVWNNHNPTNATEWWKNSSIHWNNIMDPTFKNAGIGITEEPDGGYIIVLLQGK